MAVGYAKQLVTYFGGPCSKVFEEETKTHYKTEIIGYYDPLKQLNDFEFGSLT